MLSGKKVPVSLRSLLLVMLFILPMLAACERLATLSNWEPVSTSQAMETQSALSTQMAANRTLPAPTSTLAPPFPTPESLPQVLPHSLKGYELYSWQNGNEWNFTLITGTNRAKAFEEIIAAGNSLGTDDFVKISVTGLNEIEKVLSLLPPNEQVFWAGMDLGDQVPSGTVYLTFPPQDMIDELVRFCLDRKVTLQLLKES